MRQRLGVIAALFGLVLAALALAGITFEQWRRLDADPTVSAIESYGRFLLDNWLWLVWPPLLCAVLGYVVANRFVTRSLQPIDTMRRELESINSSNLGGRVTIAGTGDEVEALGRTLNETLQRLENAVLANERLVADAAHELRTPLTAVRAALEVENTAEPRELLGESLVEIDRASKLIDDLLLLARSPSTESRLELVDLDDVVVQELRRLERLHPDVVIDHDVQPLQQRLVREAIANAVRNLLENAAKYGDGRIKITLRGDDRRSHLIVEDDGPGIPVDQRTDVLERFSRLDNSRGRSTGGSGLGLAIVAETVEAHRGDIEIAESTLGGSRIELRLPTDPTTTDPLTSAAGRRRRRGGAATAGRRRRTMIVAGVTVLVMSAGGVYAVREYLDRGASEVVAGAPASPSADPATADDDVPLDRSRWSVRASTFYEQELPERAIDGDVATRWTTGRYQDANDMWFEIDFGATRTISRIDLELNAIWAEDFPRGYTVQIITESGEMGATIARDRAVQRTFPTTVIEFEPQTMRGVRITQLGTSETQWWSIAEINAFG
ncbi:MAG: ATP-binding protein [Actinomycetota bacterium]